MRVDGTESRGDDCGALTGLIHGSYHMGRARTRVVTPLSAPYRPLYSDIPTSATRELHELDLELTRALLDEQYSKFIVTDVIREDAEFISNKFKIFQDIFVA